MQQDIVACRDILLAEKALNEEHGIWSSVNAVIERMLERELELHQTYAEIQAKLGDYPQAPRVFLDRVLTVAALWSPEQAAAMRTDLKRLRVVNAEIATRARQLADLLREREALHNETGFSSDTHYHVCEVIDQAAESNHLFKSWVRDELRTLRGRYDLKYWPRIADFVDVLAVDAAAAKIEVCEPITEAATSSQRPSRADFFKALFAAVEETMEGLPRLLPTVFRLTDESYAALANCALGLGPDDMVEGAYVKRLRQRMREAESLS